MKILVTGATGLLGGALVELLLSEGSEVRCLVREESPNLSRLDAERVEISPGNASDTGALARALHGVDSLVHVAGIEYAPQIIPAMRRTGVEHLVVVSSTSAHSAYPSRSNPKLEMEELVSQSGLSWTIVRPTMIYGSERDKNMRHLLRYLNRFSVFPMFGSGTNLWQPVYYKDCARGVLAALHLSEAVGQSYDLPGATPLPYLELVQVAAAALGREPRIVRLPLEPVRLALRFAEAVRLPCPIKSEQVIRLKEHKAYPYDKAKQELGYVPRSFKEGIALEVARLRELGLVRA